MYECVFSEQNVWQFLETKEGVCIVQKVRVSGVIAENVQNHKRNLVCLLTLDN